MLELAAHILDIAENSIRAGAKIVEIEIDENDAKDLLCVKINDNGSGMTKEEMEKIHDPFYTTKKVRRVGLGIPLLNDAAQRAGGKLIIKSEKGLGTSVEATFQLSHLDRQPMGNITTTLLALVAGNSSIDFLYKHRHNDRQFIFDTRQIRKEIDDLPINHPEILKYIRGVISEGLQDIASLA
ncbi:MAG TPA: ATP-binding protein [Smithellaceae bacterium]|nr:ATP-binding protein [Smithellaceae bacterium]HRS88612.1 ATP-binding protein [Smithellaceae bacterium]HRV25892.1 ATP-binding protein [Smithellaceae bacterium]